MRVLAGLGICLLASITSASIQDTHEKGPKEESESEHQILRRNAQIEARLANEHLYGVRKMSTDPGEKFFLEYWHFEDSRQQDGLSETDLAFPNATAGQVDKDGGIVGSSSSPGGVFTPRSFAYSPSVEPEFSLGLKSSRILDARDFKCPSNTYACTSINRPERCCNAGSVCEIVPDTGAGDVGCCPNGQTCSGTVGSCQSGYTTCSKALGGGCCISGYDCVEGGCAYVSIVTVTVGATVTLSTVTHSASQQTSMITSSTTTSTSTTSTSSSPSEHSTSSSSSTSTSASTTSSTSPARPTTTTTTTENLIPPARGTSISSLTSSTTTSTLSLCPTGFYACSAVYHGGCCQVDRNCDTFSCPTIPSTTFTSDGRTIVIPVATATATGSSTPSAGQGQRKCPGGWFQCAASDGGDCCPTGYVCGKSMCSATAGATAGAGGTGAATTVAKEQPTGSGNGASGLQVNRGVIITTMMMVVMAGLI
ncbi:hypothetical protein N7539_004271 [Penicillium diatomitis]|uniref:GPI anchored protein n=1 Tax=Penicillium diatomitis TaxID=2819901 RepID=A0A9W9XDK4_9EURO|nr:uncharacterized protein N7539_004271 [Penicillium diatomitis]KAJ5489381.1 hypothetical protein N7539_004271 [Penicillium diatomitis]